MQFWDFTQQLSGAPNERGSVDQPVRREHKRLHSHDEHYAIRNVPVDGQSAGGRRNCGCPGSVDAAALYSEHYVAVDSRIANCSNKESAGSGHTIYVHLLMGRADIDHAGGTGERTNSINTPKES
jgi:hypothetical protein